MSPLKKNGLEEGNSLKSEVFLFPVGEVLGFFQEELALGIYEELGGGAFAAENTVFLTENLVFEVESCARFTYVCGMYHGHIIHAKGSEMTDMDIINGCGDIGLKHYLIAYAGVMTAEGLAPVLEVLDVITVPHTQHGIHLAELDTYLTDVS